MLAQDLRPDAVQPQTLPAAITHRASSLLRHQTRGQKSIAIAQAVHAIASTQTTNQCNAAFYKPPVQLETEPANIVLRFALDPHSCSITHNNNNNNNITTAGTLHPLSATTTQVLRSKACIRLIQRVCSPRSHVHEAIRAMWHLYAAAGYTDDAVLAQKPATYVSALHKQRTVKALKKMIRFNYFIGSLT